MDFTITKESLYIIIILYIIYKSSLPFSIPYHNGFIKRTVFSHIINSLRARYRRDYKTI